MMNICLLFFQPASESLLEGTVIFSMSKIAFLILELTETVILDVRAAAQTSPVRTFSCGLTDRW